MMAGIKGKDTKPELIIRRGLHRLGFRYSLHKKSLPGKPDMYFRKYRAAIFVNGCFWHGHDCHLFKLPETRREFWNLKFNHNRARDARVRHELDAMGVRHLTIWECSLKNQKIHKVEAVIKSCADWLEGRTGRAL